MDRTLPLLVFTDLDGTLIAHDSYSFAAARPALAALRQAGAGVIMASSKTAPEIAALRRALDLDAWPAIVENGAGLLAAGDDAQPQSDDYARLRDILRRLPPALRQPFQGFGDMDADAVAKATGLDPAAAKLAKTRAFSEPGLWHGTAEGRAGFLRALQDHGVSAREGGRFLTLSFGATKADRMGALIAQYRPAQTVALGDAPNDTEMLALADHGVIISNPHRAPLPPMEGEATGRIIRTTAAGPAGWNTAILALLDRLQLNKDG